VTAWLLAIGRMLGLGSIAGIRPSLTLAVIGVVTYFDWGVKTNSSFAWLGWWWVIGIFVVLAILESTFDKISKLDRLQDRLIMPYRLAIGGVAGAATIPFGWQGIAAGAAVGVGAAWFAQYSKHLSRPKSVPSEAVVALISAAEDLGAFIGSVLVLAVPYFGYVCVGVSGFVYWRVRDRRRAKYKQMRRAAVVRADAESGVLAARDAQADRGRAQVDGSSELVAGSGAQADGVQRDDAFGPGAELDDMTVVDSEAAVVEADRIDDGV
jgi:uncharacterized membrane protein